MKELFQHSATTDGVTVRVAVNFLPEQSQPEAGKWFWVYHIRIENDSRETLQLRTRHWRITDGRGMVNHVDGEGVVGEQPLLGPGQSHDYVSGCPLATPHGSMEGRTELPEHADPSPMFCLLEDDSLVTKVSIESEQLLRPAQPDEVVAIISVHVKKTRLNIDNMSL